MSNIHEVILELRNQDQNHCIVGDNCAFQILFSNIIGFLQERIFLNLGSFSFQIKLKCKKVLSLMSSWRMHFLAGVDIGYVVSIICFLSRTEKIEIYQIFLELYFVHQEMQGPECKICAKYVSNFNNICIKKLHEIFTIYVF